MPEPLRVLVCGGRDYDDREAVDQTLDRLHAERGIACIIAGAARGADTLAAAWATDRGIALLEFPADWKTQGRAAGPIRNQRMLEEGAPSYVVAFPGGRGTADMVRRAEGAGLTVLKPAASPPLS